MTVAKCRACGKPIDFVKTKSKPPRYMPVDVGGTTPHFATCTDPGRFRRNGKTNTPQTYDAADGT